MKCKWGGKIAWGVFASIESVTCQSQSDDRGMKSDLVHDPRVHGCAPRGQSASRWSWITKVGCGVEPLATMRGILAPSHDHAFFLFGVVRDFS